MSFCCALAYPCSSGDSLVMPWLLADKSGMMADRLQMQHRQWHWLTEAATHVVWWCLTKMTLCTVKKQMKNTTKPPSSRISLHEKQCMCAIKSGCFQL